MEWHSILLAKIYDTEVPQVEVILLIRENNKLKLNSTRNYAVS